MSADLDGQVAVVTGGGTGIGRAIATTLAREGAAVAIVARNEERAGVAAEELERTGTRARAFAADVVDGSAVDSAFEAILKEFGRLDIVVNNSGITRDGLLLRMSDESWDEVLDTNLKGTFHCCRAAARTLIRQRSGRIVNISSVVGVIGNAGQANYVASKAGVIGLTRALARELAPRNVTVNAVAPGFIRTAMTDALDENRRNELLGSVPLGRFGEPEDVGEVVAFLASPRAAYITGQVWHVDGGMVMG